MLSSIYSSIWRARHGGTFPLPATAHGARAPLPAAGSAVHAAQFGQCSTSSQGRKRSVQAAAEGRGRHADLVEGVQVDGDAPRFEIEKDDRYARMDASQQHQYEARQAFARCIAGGEPAMRLAEAALWVSAEDDAISSHSTVAFPVPSFLDRIERITADVHNHLINTGCAPPRPSNPAESTSAQQLQQQQQIQQEVVRQVEAALFAEPRTAMHGSTGSTSDAAGPTGLRLNFRTPPKGRTGLPAHAVVDHPGTWEDARHAYLHETLIRKRGHAAALAIMYAEVMGRLLARGAVDFAVAVEPGDYQGAPRGVILPGITRAMLLRSSGSSNSGGSGSQGPGELILLNTCSSEALAELLRHLKRAYWPFAWDMSIDPYDKGGSNSHGGFRAAAKAGVGDAMSAAIRAMSTVAAWRLDRGIWTSPGAGDIRRSRAAAERLVMLHADAVPDERRDLAVLLLHMGELGAARAELRAYMDTAHFRTTADPFDKILCYKMMDLLRSAGSSIEEPKRVMSVDMVLEMPLVLREERKPLTW